jgi:hypothetical protein
MDTVDKVLAIFRAAYALPDGAEFTYDKEWSQVVLSAWGAQASVGYDFPYITDVGRRLANLKKRVEGYVIFGMLCECARKSNSPAAKEWIFNHM